MESHKLTINDLNDYLNKIFALQYEIIQKDFKLATLEFELLITKLLLESYKNF